jgi:hypothetical protein
MHICIHMNTYIQALQGVEEVQNGSDNVSDTKAENVLGDVDSSLV